MNVGRTDERVNTVGAALSSETEGDRCRAPLDPAWWARGLALHERVSAARSGQGLDRDVAVVRAESTASLVARLTRPDWAETVERAVNAAVPRPIEVPLFDGWEGGFATLLAPFVDLAVGRLSGAPFGQVDRVAVLRSFRDQLGHKLVRLASRTLVLELSRYRAAGMLHGVDGRDRFADFVCQASSRDALADLFGRYPVLGRLLGQASNYAADAMSELLTRFAADRATIVDTLLGGVDPGRLLSVHTGRGDTHRRGRSVAELTFADGAKVVYKPRDLRAHDHLACLLAWLNQSVPGLDLHTAATVCGDDYGWMEFVHPHPVENAEQAQRFYRRLGALLAVLHVLRASDMHYENVIACGDQPVFVDVETLFHPTLGAVSDDPAAVQLASSVLRTLLLPTIQVGEHGAADLSGVGGDPGQTTPDSVVAWDDAGTDEMRLARRPAAIGVSHNQPVLDGLPVDPDRYEPQLLEGFRLGYNAIMAGREAVRALVASCGDLPMRVIARATRSYATLLDESTHPELLTDVGQRDQLFDLLRTDAGRDQVRAAVLPHEIVDLWHGDIPVFTARPSTTQVLTSTGLAISDVLPSQGMTSATEALDGLDDADRQVQEWAISASLATRVTLQPHSVTESRPASGGVAAEPQRLLAAACAIADQIVVRGIGDTQRVNWLGLELVDDERWLVLPMGASLSNGYVGVALFLAEVAALTGLPRYGEVARHALSSLPALVDRLAAAPGLVRAIGCGGYHGFGGIAYGLTRISVLLDDADLVSTVDQCVQLAWQAHHSGASHGWASGSAGCLAAMTSVHAELGLPSAERLAVACADTLVEVVDNVDRLGREPEGGFAEGMAGVAAALGRLPGSRYRHAALAAAAHAGATGEGWCRGSAGVIAGTTALLDTSAEVIGLAKNAMPTDLSLCHGELGIVEALISAGLRLDDSMLRQRAGQILDVIQRHGPSCGTPNQVPSAGLLTGLSGIGQGLLRLGVPESIPSVLLLHPSR